MIHTKPQIPKDKEPGTKLLHIGSWGDTPLNPISSQPTTNCIGALCHTVSKAPYTYVYEYAHIEAMFGDHSFLKTRFQRKVVLSLSVKSS